MYHGFITEVHKIETGSFDRQKLDENFCQESEVCGIQKPKKPTLILPLN